MVTRKFTQEEVKRISSICSAIRNYVTEVIIDKGNIIQYDDQVQIIFDIRDVIKDNNNFTWIISDIKSNYPIFDIFDEFTLTIDDERGYFEISDNDGQHMQIRFVEPSNVTLQPEDLRYEVIHSIKLGSAQLKKIKKMIDMVRNITFDIVDENGKLIMFSNSRSKTKKFSTVLCDTPKQLKNAHLRYLFVVFDVVTKLSDTGDIELQFIDNEGEIDLLVKVDDNTKIIGRKIEKEMSELIYTFDEEKQEEVEEIT